MVLVLKECFVDFLAKSYLFVGFLGYANFKYHFQ
jgi:hypothetical protein